MAALLFIGTVLLTIFINLISEDVKQWLNDVAKWYVRRYAARWPCGQRARIEEEVMADLADAQGVLHKIKHLVFLRGGAVPTADGSSEVGVEPTSDEPLPGTP